MNTNTNVFAEILEDIGSTLNKTFSTETHQCLSLALQKATSTVIFLKFFILFLFFFWEHLIFQIETISKKFGTALHQSQCKKFVKLFGKEKNFGFVYLFVHISFREEKQNWK